MHVVLWNMATDMTSSMVAYLASLHEMPKASREIDMSPSPGYTFMIGYTIKSDVAKKGKDEFWNIALVFQQDEIMFNKRLKLNVSVKCQLYYQAMISLPRIITSKTVSGHAINGTLIKLIIIPKDDHTYLDHFYFYE